MQIILDQDEMTRAIHEYLNNYVAISKDANVSIEYIAGRGERGHSCVIDIESNAIGNANHNNNSVTGAESKEEPEQVEALEPVKAEPVRKPRKLATKVTDNTTSDDEDSESKPATKKKLFKAAKEDPVEDPEEEEEDITEEEEEDKPKSIFSRKASK